MRRHAIAPISEIRIPGDYRVLRRILIAELAWVIRSIARPRATSAKTPYRPEKRIAKLEAGPGGRKRNPAHVITADFVKRGVYTSSESCRSRIRIDVLHVLSRAKSLTRIA